MKPRSAVVVEVGDVAYPVEMMLNPEPVSGVIVGVKVAATPATDDALMMVSGPEIENVSVCPVVEDVSVSVQLRVCVPLTGVVGRLV